MATSGFFMFNYFEYGNNLTDLRRGVLMIKEITGVDTGNVQALRNIEEREIKVKNVQNIDEVH